LETNLAFQAIAKESIMTKLVILGSANAVTSPDHENAHMAIVGIENTLLIDCPTNPLVRLKKLGVPLEQISDLVLTHFHPDHVSGVPLFLMDLWLLGRINPLQIHGLEYTIDRVEKVLELHDWSAWPNFYPLVFNRFPEQEMVAVVERAEFRLFASPVNHLVPNIGLRIEFSQTNKAMAYSSDTEPCQQVIRLAGGVDVLVHEAAGAAKGHTSPRQAGQVASQAEAKSLYLIHYPCWDIDPQPFIGEAQETFAGQVKLAVDLLEIKF
jgi:ribonuclease Z